MFLMKLPKVQRCTFLTKKEGWTPPTFLLRNNLFLQPAQSDVAPLSTAEFTLTGRM